MEIKYIAEMSQDGFENKINDLIGDGWKVVKNWGSVYSHSHGQEFYRAMLAR